MTRVDAGDVGHDELAELGVFDERGFLQSCDFVVVDLHHVVIGQRSTRLVVDLEAGVEFQHVQQLETDEKRNILNQNPIHFKVIHKNG